MTEHQSEPNLTVANLKKDLDALRTHGLWPAIEKGDVPLLTWLVRRLAASHDPVALERLTSATADEPRQATADGIRALIESIATNLPLKGEKGIPELFAFDASSAETTPEKPQRNEKAGEAIGFSAGTVERRRARRWIGWLSALMYEQYGEYASAQAESLTPEGPPVDTKSQTDVASVAPEQGTTPPISKAPEQPPESTPTPAPTKAPAIDDEPPKRQRRRGLKPAWRRLRFPVSGALVLGVGAVVVVIATNQDQGATSTHCGPTTAQLVTPPSGSNPISMEIYAPAQENGEHGWANTTPDGIDKPKVEELFFYNEVRRFALQYGNFGEPQRVVAKLGNTDGAKLAPDSTCVYRHGKYSSGTSYRGTQLAAPAGLQLGTVATFEMVYVTFNMLLPATPQHDSYEVAIEGGIDAAGTQRVSEPTGVDLKLSP
jgi:hypothetical protein